MRNSPKPIFSDNELYKIRDMKKHGFSAKDIAMVLGMAENLFLGYIKKHIEIFGEI